MSDPVLEVAQALTPLLAAGADGAVAEATRQAGEGAAAATRRVIEAVRAALGGAPPDQGKVADALREQLQRGAFTEADLVHTMKVVGIAGDNYGVQVKGNAYIDTSIHVEGGDFHG